jgi:hypothetical protein
VANAELINHGIHRIESSRQSVEFSFCNLCNSFMGQGINQLLNAILNVGVAGGCAELCQAAFPSKESEAKICNLLCDGVGIYTFIHLLEKFGKDIDTIYFCELLKACPVHDGGAASIDKITVNPPSGPQGTTFEIDVFFSVKNETSTGEMVFDVKPPKSMPFGDGELDEGFQPGQYAVKFTLQAEPSEQEAFEPGTYNFQFALCDGECGAPYPHTSLLAAHAGNFTITQ